MRRLLPALLCLLLASPPLHAASDGDLDLDFGFGGARRVAFDLAGDDRDFVHGLARA